MVNLFGGVEAGGTKFVCMAGRSPDDILAEGRFSTGNPSETIKKVINFFKPFVQKKELAAIGIASFGPVDLNPTSKTFGFITSTPKVGWENVDLRGEIQRGLKLPIAFDTDVNAAAFGEKYWTTGNQLLDPLIYITVGTGIGVGVIINGSPLHGLVHAEAGHIAIPHDWKADPFPGVCPFHGDCLEGLASGVSMDKRWGRNPEKIPDSHPAWDLETNYIALALVNLIYAYSPQKIILGGGVSQHPGFHQSVRENIKRINNAYINSIYLNERIEDYLSPPALGNRSGALGAIAMAKNLTLKED